MVSVDLFLDDVVRDMRRRMELMGDCGDRRAIEDGIALLTDYRLSGMDEDGLARLLASLRSGRSPVALAVLRPSVVASELAARWTTYAEGVGAPALI